MYKFDQECSYLLLLLEYNIDIIYGYNLKNNVVQFVILFFNLD